MTNTKKGIIGGVLTLAVVVGVIINLRNNRKRKTVVKDTVNASTGK